MIHTSKAKRAGMRGSMVYMLCVVLGLCLVTAWITPAQGITDEEILDRVMERVAAYPELKNMEARVASTLQVMDKRWKPKKTTLVDKLIRMTDGLRSEEILSAQETHKGRTQDVTAEMAKDTRKQEEKARKRRAKKGEGDKEKKGGRGEMTREQMFPFGEDRRQGYDFNRKGDSYVGKRPAYVLETRAKTRSAEWVEGLYYIGKQTFDVLKAEIRFAKNPKMLKRFEMEAWFRVLPEGYLVMERLLMRIHVGLVVKSIRMQVQEEYRDFKILD